MNTFFRTCVYICVVLILFTLAINFINTLGAFPVTIDSGMPPPASGNRTTDLFVAFTGFDGGMAGIFLLFTSVGALASLGISWLVNSPAPTGVYIFSVIFWSTYNGAINTINALEWIPADLLLMGTVGMVFIFAGAVIGMLTGSG